MIELRAIIGKLGPTPALLAVPAPIVPMVDSESNVKESLIVET